MKKGVKISLIVVPIVIIVLAGASFGGTLLYTANNVNYSVGTTTITEDIIQGLLGAFSGEVVTETPLSIVNNGLYSILDLFITVTVLGQDFSLETLNGLVLGEGDNIIGTINKGESWNGSIVISLDSINIPALAIYDGKLVIKIDLSFKLDFGIFKAAQAPTEYQSKIGMHHLILFKFLSSKKKD